MIKRIILLIGYVAVSIYVSLFFGLWGHGSMAPTAILGSWTIVFWRLLIVKSIYVGLVIFLLYLIGLFLLTTITSRRAETAHPLIPAAVHGIGSLVALAVIQVIGHLATPIRVITSYILSIAIAWFYLSLDWRLARRSKIDEQ